MLFLEKVVLVLLVAFLGDLAITNKLGLDKIERTTLAIAALGLTGFICYELSKDKSIVKVDPAPTAVPVAPQPDNKPPHEPPHHSNPAKKTEPAPAAKIAGEKDLPSADEEFPFGLEVTLVANRDIAPMALELQFSGEVGRFQATQPIGAYEQQQGGIIVERPDTVFMQRKAPAFTPQSPIIVYVYSKSKITTKKLQSVPFSFPRPAGYLK